MGRIYGAQNVGIKQETSQSKPLKLHTQPYIGNSHHKETDTGEYTQNVMRIKDYIWN
jgi:hypothetical protein